MATHGCSTLVIRCMDYRLDDSIREYLASLGKRGDYDLVSIAGAAKDLAENGPAADTIRIQIDISVRLHHATDVLIIHHTDCGAYGGHAAFPSPEAERERHISDMRAARAAIAKAFPALSVTCVLARMHEDDSIDFEVIS